MSGGEQTFIYITMFTISPKIHSNLKIKNHRKIQKSNEKNWRKVLITHFIVTKENNLYIFMKVL